MPVLDLFLHDPIVYHQRRNRRKQRIGISANPSLPPLNMERPALWTCRNSPDQPLLQDLSYDRIPRYGTPDEHDSVLGEVDGSISYTLCEVQGRGERRGDSAEDGHLRKRLC